jgi:hypothetical protein
MSLPVQADIDNLKAQFKNVNAQIQAMNQLYNECLQARIQLSTNAIINQQEIYELKQKLDALTPVPNEAVTAD